MAKTCANCGNELPVGVMFCPECGTRVNQTQTFVPPEPEPEALPAAAAAAAAVAPEPEPAPAPAPDPVYPSAPSPAPAPRQQEREQRNAGQQRPAPRQENTGGVYPGPAAQKAQKPVSTIGFMLLELLYAIPIIGFFASLVLAIAPEKKDLKHHALASFLWKVIILALLIFGAVRLGSQVQQIWNQMSQSVQQNGIPADNLQDWLNSMGVSVN